MCDLPVALRNFTTRHCHPEIDNIPPRGMDEEEADEEHESPRKTINNGRAEASSTSQVVPAVRKNVVASDCVAVRRDKRRHRSHSLKSTSTGSKRRKRDGADRHRELPYHPPSRAAASTGSSSPGSSVSKSEVVEISEDTAVDIAPPRANTSSTTSSADYVKNAKRSSVKHSKQKRKRKDARLDLLKSRPDDDQGDAMSAWLMAVNSVSDPKWGKTLTLGNKSIAERDDDVDSSVTTSTSSSYTSSSEEFVRQQKKKRRRKAMERHYSSSSSSSSSTSSFSSVSTMEDEDEEDNCRTR